MSLNERHETCHILVPNQPRNAELLTVRLGLQWNRWSIIHRVKHITV